MPPSSGSSAARSNWGVWEETSLARESSWTDRCVVSLLSWLWEHKAHQLTFIVIFTSYVKEPSRYQLAQLAETCWNMLRHVETISWCLLIFLILIFLSCELCTIHGMLQGTWFVAGRIRARLRWVLQCPLRAPRSVGGHNDVWSNLSKNLRCRSVWPHGGFTYMIKILIPQASNLFLSHTFSSSRQISLGWVETGWNCQIQIQTDAGWCIFFDMCGHGRHLFHSSIECTILQ